MRPRPRARRREGESRATPGVVFKEPTDPEFAIKSARHAYRSILEECKQSHMVGEGTAEASGVAYQQARADYEDDLADMKGALEALLRATLEAAIAWAEAMMGSGSPLLERYRLTVDLTVQSGPITADEQEQNNGNVRAGTLSIETAMAQNGVEDVDAELRRIRESPESVVKLRKEQIMAIMEMAREGIPLSVGAQIVGISDPDELAQWREAERAMATPNAQERAQDDEIDRILAGTGAEGA